MAVSANVILRSKPLKKDGTGGFLSYLNSYWY